MKNLKSSLIRFCLFPLLFACSSTPEKSQTTASSNAASVGRASYDIVRRDGVELVQMVLKDQSGVESLALTVAPEAGTNIVSLRFRGIEILEQPKSAADIAKQDAGIEFLYPTPNRVRNGELNYKNLKLKFEPNLQGHFIHGLAREFAWQYEKPALSDTKIVYKTWLEVSEGSDFFKRFPIKNRVGMTITLEGSQVVFAFEVENLDPKPLPFGFGIHPYFALRGSRTESSVKMHVASQMDAKDLIPTGKTIPLKKTKYARLADGMTIQQVLGADTVFWPTHTDRNAIVTEPQLRFEIAASQDFGHTVLWAPPTRELFAVENQTSSTDAHNLANKGFVKQSGLLELAPGEKWTGSVSYLFSGN